MILTQDRVDLAKTKIFSVFENIEEQIKFENLQVNYIKAQIEQIKNETRKNIIIDQKIKKLIRWNKNSTVFINTSVFIDNTSDKTKGDILKVSFFLPKISGEYLKTIIGSTLKDKVISFFMPFIFLPVIAIYSKSYVEKNGRMIFDILSIDTQESSLIREDAIKYSKRWLNKYYPENNFTIKDIFDYIKS